MARETLASLKDRIMMLEAQQVSRLHTSYMEVQKLSMNNYKGSGLIIQITNLSGKVVLQPTMIADGLSNDLIAALKDNFSASQAQLLRWAEIPKESK